MEACSDRAYATPPSTPSDRWPDVSRIFDAALELPPAARAAYVESACAGDTLLRDEVVGLLGAPAPDDDFFDQGGSAYAAPFVLAVGAEPIVADGARVGPYRIVAEAGHGGMGTVYLAERDDDAYRKRVAVKLVRGGLHLRRPLGPPLPRGATDPRLARASRHREAAGRRGHRRRPSVVRDGVRRRRADRSLLPPTPVSPSTARSASFLSVCDAVQYAHRNLVIHRDLKPSNILVTAAGRGEAAGLRDREDLGNDGAAHQPERTRRALTPEYASPEQVRGSAIAVASDVYSLGVVLYELLTGQRPYQLTSREPHELVNAILTEVPLPASERAPPRDRRRLRGDLDTILATALRKEPDRRYRTVEALAADLRRHLDGLPVTARRDTWAYRAGKFVSRHRLGVLTGAAVAVALLCALGAALWQAGVASKEAAKEREVRRFLVDVFRVSSPDQSRGSDISARELLDQGARRADSALAGQPEVLSELLSVLGQIHLELGLFPRADTLFRRSVELARRDGGEEDLVVADRLAGLATALIEEARIDAADSLLQQVLAVRRRERGDQDSSVAATLGLLASVQWRHGNYERAESLHRAALAIDRHLLGNEHPVVAEDLNDLAVVLTDAGKLPAADSADAGIGSHSTEAAAARRSRPPDLTAQSRQSPPQAGRAARGGAALPAGASRRGAVSTRTDIPSWPPISSISVISWCRPAGGRRPAHSSKKRWRCGAPCSDPTTPRPSTRSTASACCATSTVISRGRRSTFGRSSPTGGARSVEDHPSTMMATNNLGAILRDQRRFQESESLMRSLLATRRRVFGQSHPDVAQSLQNLALLLRMTGRPDEAERSLHEALAIDQRVLPAGSPLTAGIQMELGSLLTERGRAGEGEPLLRESLATFVDRTGASSTSTGRAEGELGACLAARRQYQEAERLLLDSYAVLSMRPGYWGAKRSREVLRRLVTLYDSWGAPERGSKYRSLLRSMPEPLP